MPRQACFGEISPEVRRFKPSCSLLLLRNPGSLLFPWGGYYSKDVKDRSDVATVEMTVTGLAGDELVSSIPYKHILRIHLTMLSQQRLCC